MPNCKSNDLQKLPYIIVENVIAFSDDLRKKGIMNGIGLKSHERSTRGTTFQTPLFFIQKNDSLKTVLDARHLILNTDQAIEFSPKELLVTKFACIGEQGEYAIDEMNA